MRASQLSLLAIFALVTKLAPLHGQCNTYEWKPGDGIPGLNDNVYALTTWERPGPKPALLVAGGDFTIAGGVLANFIAAWDGASWSPLGSGMSGCSATGCKSSVSALTVYNGDLIAGGRFATAGGVNVNGIAKWDGNLWSPLGGGMSGCNGGADCVPFVSALTVYNGDLIAAGQFKTAGGVSVNHIARWNGTSWSPLGNGMNYPNSTVYVLTVYNGKLIAGGDFLLAGGVAASHIARWDGTKWSPLGDGLNDIVYDMTVQGNDLIAAGWFNATLYTHISSPAKWNGSGWSSLGDGLYGASALCVFNGVLIAEDYQWDGATWTRLGGPISGREYPSVDALTIYNGELVIAGRFRSAGGVGAENIARWDSNNPGSWAPLGTGMTGCFGQYCTTAVSAMTEYDHGLVFAGDFISAGNISSATGLARWDPGAPIDWSSLGGGINDHPAALTVFKGELIAGGYFTTAGGVSVRGVAKWDGKNWSPLGFGLNGVVFSLAVFDGDLIAGGWFTTGGDVELIHIARWDGMNWWPLGNGVENGGLLAGVHALTVFNGELIAAGQFSTAGGISAMGVAKWDGRQWSSLGSGTNAAALALAVYNGELIAGGDFTIAGGIAAKGIAKWDPSGQGKWSALGAGLRDCMDFPCSQMVSALVVYNGRLIAGGNFTAMGSVAANGIAQWDGTSWSTMGAGTSCTTFVCRSTVSDLIVYNGELIAGGEFTVAGGDVSAYWARWSCAQPMLLSARSRKTHANSPAPADFDVLLPLNSVKQAAIEPRADGPTRIVLTFSEPIEAQDGLLDATEVDLSAGSLVGISIRDSQLTLDLAGVPDGSCLAVRVKGLTDWGGNPMTGPDTVYVRSLAGDVNGDGNVNLLDLQAAKSQSVQPVTPDNFRADINLSGTINLLDLQAIKDHLLASAACH